MVPLKVASLKLTAPNNPVIPARSDTRWYQVPLLWLCLVMFVMMLMGCIHLIVISLQFDDAHGVSEQEASTGAFFRMPLSKENAVDKNAGAALGRPASNTTERVNASDPN
jgi:hypothetical protein